MVLNQYVRSLPTLRANFNNFSQCSAAGWAKFANYTQQTRKPLACQLTGLTEASPSPNWGPLDYYSGLKGLQTRWG